MRVPVQTLAGQSIIEQVVFRNFAFATQLAANPLTLVTNGIAGQILIPVSVVYNVRIGALGAADIANLRVEYSTAGSTTGALTGSQTVDLTTGPISQQRSAHIRFNGFSSVPTVAPIQGDFLRLTADNNVVIGGVVSSYCSLLFYRVQGTTL